MYCTESSSISLWGVPLSQREINQEISFKEFQSLLLPAIVFTNLIPEFYPDRWVLIGYAYCASYKKSSNLIQYKFEDIQNKQYYVVNSDKTLVEISKSTGTNESININIPIPDKIWSQIEFILVKNKSINKQINQIQLKTKNKGKLTKEESELVKLMESIQDKSFDEIFNAITKYRIERYNKGLTDDLVIPYKKIKNDFNKLKSVLIENNYEQFSSLKKWIDKVIFLDKK